MFSPDNDASSTCDDDIKFILISVKLDFSNHFTGIEPREVQTFLELPQSSSVLADDNAIDANPTTWGSTSDLHTLSTEDVQHNILRVTRQKGAALLKKGKYGNGNANLDYTKAQPCIMDALVEDCFQGILNSLFKATFPNAQFNTLDAIGNIKKCYKDAQGNKCCMSS